MVEQMILNKVKLQNFISHRETVIEFSRGVNVFIGPNGAGKSSILEAIYYALTGKGWRTERSKKPLINQNASTATVELEFSIGGRRYVVRRRIGAPGTILIENGKTIARDERSVNEALKNILGVNVERLEKIALIPQGGITEIFVEASSGERKEIVDSMLGLQDYEVAGEKLGDYPVTTKSLKHITMYTLRPWIDGKLDERVEELRRSIKAYYERIVGEIRELKNRIRSLEEEIGEKKRIIREERLRERVEEKKRVEEEYNRVYEKYIGLKKELEGLEKQISEYTGSIEEKRGEMESLEKEIEELSKELSILSYEEEISRLEKLIDENKHLVERLEEIRDELRRLEENLSRIEELRRKYPRKLDEVEAERGRVEEETSRVEERIREVEARILSLRAEIEKVGEEIKLLRETSKPNCPLCGRPLTDQHRREIIDRLVREREEYERALESLKNELEKLREERKRLEEKLRKLEVEREGLIKLKTLMESFDRGKYESYKARVLELEAKIRENNEWINRFIGEAGELGVEQRDPQLVLEVLKKRLSHAKSMSNRLSELRGREEALKREVEELDRRLRELRERYSRVVEEVRSVEEKLNTLNKELEELKIVEKKLVEYETLIENLSKQLSEERKRLEERLVEVEEFKKEVSEVNKAIRKAYVLSWIRQHLFHRDGLPKILRRKYIGLLTSMIEDLMSRFNLEYHSVSIDEDYGIKLKSMNYPGKEIDIRVISGGEKVVVSLVSMLALYKLVSGGRIGFLALDEPTEYLDFDRRDELINVLKEFQGGKIMPQLLIVTHDESVREAGDRIFKVYKEKGYSRVEEWGMI